MTPILLIILDGLGDRQHSELGGRTPLEAARTPNLDALAAAGVTGLMWPLGPGVAPTSPLAHMVLFGYQPDEFPGRGLIEALGESHVPNPGDVVCRVNFCRCDVRDGALWIASRPDPRVGDAINDDVVLDGIFEDARCRFIHTGAAQGLLFLSPLHAEPLSGEVTDADPLREGEFARSVVPWSNAHDPGAAARTARALNAWMKESRRRLAGRELDTALVKWASAIAHLTDFTARTGLRGATVARGTLYRGLAQVIGMATPARPADTDPVTTLREDLAWALTMLQEGGHDFVHVHTKAPDEAGHRKSPDNKRAVIEALDAALSEHLERLRSGDLVVCVTADHQTPSAGPLYHAGGAVPVLICGGSAGRDDTHRFSERACLTGALGHIRGTDLMPLLLDCADRGAFVGAERYTAEACLGATSPMSTPPLEGD